MKDRLKVVAFDDSVDMSKWIRTVIDAALVKAERKKGKVKKKSRPYCWGGW